MLHKEPTKTMNKIISKFISEGNQWATTEARCHLNHIPEAKRGEKWGSNALYAPCMRPTPSTTPEDNIQDKGKKISRCAINSRWCNKKKVHKEIKHEQSATSEGRRGLNQRVDAWVNDRYTHAQRPMLSHLSSFAGHKNYTAIIHPAVFFPFFIQRIIVLVIIVPFLQLRPKKKM